MRCWLRLRFGSLFARKRVEKRERGGGREATDTAISFHSLASVFLGASAWFLPEYPFSTRTWKASKA